MKPIKVLWYPSEERKKCQKDTVHEFLEREPNLTADIHYPFWACLIDKCPVVHAVIIRIQGTDAQFHDALLQAGSLPFPKCEKNKSVS